MTTLTASQVEQYTKWKDCQYQGLKYHCVAMSWACDRFLNPDIVLIHSVPLLQEILFCWLTFTELPKASGKKKYALHTFATFKIITFQSSLKWSNFTVNSLKSIQFTLSSLLACIWNKHEEICWQRGGLVAKLESGCWHNSVACCSETSIELCANACEEHPGVHNWESLPCRCRATRRRRQCSLWPLSQLEGINPNGKPSGPEEPDLKPWRTLLVGGINHGI